MKTADKGLIPLKTVSEKLGLEESLLRFYEKIFSSCLPAKITDGGRLVYPYAVIELFSKIHQLKSQQLSDEKINIQLGPYLPVGKQQSSRSLARIITVTSGKGGVGKSSISLNLAIALRLRGKKVMLVDGDLGLANLHLLARIPVKHTLETLIKMDLPLVDIITTGPAGVAMIAGASGIAEMANLPTYKRNHLLEQLEKLEQVADYIIIDTSSGITPSVLDFIRVADDLLLVVTPDITSLADAYGVIKTCSHQHIDTRIGIFTNQVSNLSQAAEVYQRLNSCCRQFLNRTLANLGYLYRDRSVERAVRNRQPFIMEPVKSRASFCIRQLAELLDSPEFDVATRNTPAFRRLQNLIHETEEDGRFSQIF
ncbi:MAG: AAA family ATPase [Deltaproteobacteria bacterium]|nr:AAA family ATPase [Candidatus Anaeroferrophillus wilburensis]MBN2889059.1 AAA family ATPase [Deltaproteobacteria bacterium]